MRTDVLASRGAYIHGARSTGRAEQVAPQRGETIHRMGMPRVGHVAGRDRPAYRLLPDNHQQLSRRTEVPLAEVPVHGNRDVAEGTLRGILNDVGMTIDQLAP